MKKTTIAILASLMMFCVTACGDKPAKQPAQANQEAVTAPPTRADSTQTINETCLIFIAPETKEFEDENSAEAEAYFNNWDGFGFYMAQGRTQFERTGIKDIMAEKRYLSFALDNGEKHVVDTKEAGMALLYKKGKAPIEFYPAEILSDDEVDQFVTYLEIDRKLLRKMEEELLHMLNTYQNGNDNVFNKLLVPDFGVAYVNAPGIYNVVNMYKGVTFSEEQPDRLHLYGTGISIGSGKVKFESAPSFDCGELKWTKPAGIYCDTTSIDKTLSGLSKQNNELGISNWTSKELKKFEDLEKRSHSVFILGEGEKEGEDAMHRNTFLFGITYWEGKWRIYYIKQYDPCGT